jgi:hypothetical protein
MLYEMYLLFWVMCIVFTMACFQPQNRGQLFFPLITFLLWQSLAVFGTEIDFIWAGSINVVEAHQAMGDPGYEWLIGLSYVFHGIGLVMLLFGLYDTFIVAKSALMDYDDAFKSGKPYDIFPRYRSPK